ncbi:MAG: ABC transporter substrate-binding protein [Halofilum sp. (in: g-proteobacteria)]|nr:ABC transporter substrate-binding protein [Halofilum sp. (in: g-proteobacteria)]
MRTTKPRNAIAAATLAILTTMGMATTAVADAPTIRFGTPTWPGVTVKTEVAAQLVETMGYAVEQTNASPAFAYNALTSDDLDVFLGGWMPTQENMLDPLVEKEEVEVLATNISDAVMGIAVPKYVWDAGVRTEADLAAHADKFEHTIYGIEPGTGFNESIKDAIANDRHGLGDWEMVPSSTSGMLSQVGRSIEREEWIVFLGWEPHWMNVAYDIEYLEAVGEPKIAATRSDVLTVGNPKTMKAHPEIARFLRQYVVDKQDQSEWVLEYSYEDRDKEVVASEWIAANLDTVAAWLDGVKARDGGPAIEAVRAKYGN